MNVRFSSFALALVLFSGSACSNKSICPFPNASAVETSPLTQCLEAHVDTCIDPTLVIKNGCDAALYVPAEYGRFDEDVIGADKEVGKGQTIHYVVRPEKATSVTDKRKEWVIPMRVTTQKLEMKFSISSD